MPHRSVALFNSTMASEEGFEPPTDSLEGYCSIQLSYSDAFNSAMNIITYSLLNVKPFMTQIVNYIIVRKIHLV